MLSQISPNPSFDEEHAQPPQRSSPDHHWSLPLDLYYQQQLQSLSCFPKPASSPPELKNPNYSTDCKPAPYYWSKRNQKSPRLKDQSKNQISPFFAVSPSKSDPAITIPQGQTVQQADKYNDDNFTEHGRTKNLPPFASRVIFPNQPRETKKPSPG